EGTAALPKEPSSSKTSTSTVGLPRESIISLAYTSIIVVSIISTSIYIIDLLLFIEKDFSCHLFRLFNTQQIQHSWGNISQFSILHFNALRSANIDQWYRTGSMGSKRFSFIIQHLFRITMVSR